MKDEEEILGLKAYPSPVASLKETSDSARIKAQISALVWKLAEERAESLGFITPSYEQITQHGMVQAIYEIQEAFQTQAVFAALRPLLADLDAEIQKKGRR